MKNSKVLYLTRAALVAAMYVALTWVSHFFGLASGAVQLRLSEVLCVLPFFMPASVPGLFVGCIISNLTMSANIFDIIFGSLATLVGAYLASKLKNKLLVPLPTVIANTIVVPLVIVLCYTPEVESPGAYLLVTLGVFLGEVISAYVLGMVLLLALDKRKEIFTKKH